MIIGMIFHSIYDFLRKILLFLTNTDPLFISRIFDVKIVFLHYNFNCINVFFMFVLEYLKNDILGYSRIFSDILCYSHSIFIKVM